MAMSTTDEPTRGLQGPDPGPIIRCWVAMVLRVGVGLSLLNIGIAGYMATQPGPGGPGLMVINTNFPAITPFIGGLPYAAIALGLALILGFLTTFTAIATACFFLLVPVLTAVSFLGSGPGLARGFGPGPDLPIGAILIAAFYLPSLVPQVLLIWMSPLANHPFSVDALIFGRAPVADPSETPPTVPATSTAAEEAPAASP